MKETTNYKLKKIELTDSPPDITVHSENFDIIDEEMKRQDDAFIAHKVDYTSPHQYLDEGTDPDWIDVKYRLVMINGEPFMEVVEV